MRHSIRFTDPYAEQTVTWWSRVGITSITFFLAKGLLWLLAPVLFTLWQ